MTCTETLELIDGGGQLSDVDQVQLAAHLATCPACRAVVALDAQVLRALAAERSLAPSHALQAALLAVPDRERRRRALVPLVIPLAGVMCAMSTALLWLALPAQPPPVVQATPTSAVAVQAAPGTATPAIVRRPARATAAPSSATAPGPRPFSATAFPRTPTAVAAPGQLAYVPAPVGLPTSIPGDEASRTGLRRPSPDPSATSAPSAPPAASSTSPGLSPGPAATLTPEVPTATPDGDGKILIPTATSSPGRSPISPTPPPAGTPPPPPPISPSETPAPWPTMVLPPPTASISPPPTGTPTGTTTVTPTATATATRTPTATATP